MVNEDLKNQSAMEYTLLHLHPFYYLVFTFMFLSIAMSVTFIRHIAEEYHDHRFAQAYDYTDAKKFTIYLILTAGGSGPWFLSLRNYHNGVWGMSGPLFFWLAQWFIGAYCWQAIGAFKENLTDYYREKRFLEAAAAATTAATHRPQKVEQQTAKPTEPASRRINKRAFDHLIGVEHAIEEFKQALELPMLHPELIEKYKVDLTRGILLYGPPGTGKTSLVRAVAQYFNVPFVYRKSSELLGTGVVGSPDAAIVNGHFHFPT